VRKAFLVSIALHLGFGLALGLWICPWFEKITPDAHGVVDLDLNILNIGKVNHAGNEHSAKPPAAKLQTHPQSEVLNTTTEAQVPVTAKPAPASDLLTIDSEQGTGPQTLNPQGYTAWVTHHNSPPQYPRLARIRNETGRVVIKVVLSQRGSPPERVEVLSPSGSEILDRTGLETAQRWHYPPFKAEKSQIVLSIPYVFDIEAERR
jgi:TonB family protein